MQHLSSADPNWPGQRRCLKIRSVCIKCKSLYGLSSLIEEVKNKTRPERCQKILFRTGKESLPCNQKLVRKVILKGNKEE